MAPRTATAPASCRACGPAPTPSAWPTSWRSPPTRLERLAADPPGLYAEVADPAGDLEERTWLAFQIAYLGPLDGDEPFAAIEQARTTWASGEPPDLEGVPTGPRTAYEPGAGPRTIDAYRAWAQRSGSQAAAFAGEAAWTPERRFARAFERLALPGLDRGARFDLLATLGRLGVYELRAGALGFGGNDTVTLAAKRVLGIGDPLLLERRAARSGAGLRSCRWRRSTSACTTGSAAPGRRSAWPPTTSPIRTRCRRQRASASSVG